jgi:hypothetical protein
MVGAYPFRLAQGKLQLFQKLVLFLDIATGIDIEKKFIFSPSSSPFAPVGTTFCMAWVPFCMTRVPLCMGPPLHGYPYLPYGPAMVGAYPFRLAQGKLQLFQKLVLFLDIATGIDIEKKFIFSPSSSPFAPVGTPFCMVGTPFCMTWVPLCMGTFAWVPLSLPYGPTMVGAYPFWLAQGKLQLFQKLVLFLDIATGIDIEKKFIFSPSSSPFARSPTPFCMTWVPFCMARVPLCMGTFAWVPLSLSYGPTMVGAYPFRLAQGKLQLFQKLVLFLDIAAGIDIEKKIIFSPSSSPLVGSPPWTPMGTAYPVSLASCYGGTVASMRALARGYPFLRGTGTPLHGYPFLHGGYPFLHGVGTFLHGTGTPLHGYLCMGTPLSLLWAGHGRGISISVGAGKVATISKTCPFFGHSRGHRH